MQDVWTLALLMQAMLRYLHRFHGLIQRSSRISVINRSIYLGSHLHVNPSKKHNVCASTLVRTTFAAQWEMPKRAKSTTAQATAEHEDVAAVKSKAEPAAALASEAATPSKHKKSRAKEPAAVVAADEPEATDGEAEAVTTTPSKRRRTSKAAAAKKQDEVDVKAEGGEAEEKETAKKPRKSPKKKQPPKEAGAADENGAAGEVEAAAEKPKPRRKRKEPEPDREVYSEAMRPPAPEGPCTKIMSFNVAGLRAVLNKHPDIFKDLLKREAPDVICLQETKISDKHVAGLLPTLGLPDGWHAEWSCSEDKLGYSGVATLSRIKPLSVQIGFGHKDHDGEGRLIVTEFPDFYVLNTYVPNSGEGLKRLDYRVNPGGWDETLATQVNKLQKSKPVVVVGDLNCAHKEIDIKNPKTNLRSAGFTQEERDSFSTRLLGDRDSDGCGLIDTYRHQYPEVVGYTYYSYRFNCRAKGIGWRLDYCLASPELLPRLHDSWMLPDVMGSDHIPLGITLKDGTLEGTGQQAEAKGIPPA